MPRLYYHYELSRHHHGRREKINADDTIHLSRDRYLTILDAIMDGRSMSDTLDHVIEELNRFRGKTALHDDIILIGMEIT